MPPFTGDLVASDMDLPVDDDASAYACPEYHAENDLSIGGGAIDGLRKCEAIRVILNAYLPPQSGSKVAVKGLAI
jgi:hypothetical protein